MLKSTTRIILVMKNANVVVVTILIHLVLNDIVVFMRNLVGNLININIKVVGMHRYSIKGKSII